MATTNQPSTFDNSSEEAKIGYNEKHGEATHVDADGNHHYHDGGHFQDDADHHLHRGLKSRQITMIAIGGALGTGLIIGTYVMRTISMRLVNLV